MSNTNLEDFPVALALAASETTGTELRYGGSELEDCPAVSLDGSSGERQNPVARCRELLYNNLTTAVMRIGER